MITTNSGFDAANARMAKMPIYAFAIAGQTVVYTTHDLARNGITGTLPTSKAWLKTPEGAPQTIDVVSGQSSIGELVCEVVDPDGTVRTQVGTHSLEGAAVTLSIGYPGMAWTDFVVLNRYVLYKINPTGGYTSWNFVARDRQLLMKKTVYLNPENGDLLSADNPWYLTGTPCEIFQAITLFALGLDVADIDRDQMVKLDSPYEGIFAGARPFEFALSESFEAKQFLETEVFKAAGLYLVVNNLGQMSLRASRPPGDGPAPGFTFTADNMTVLPQIDRLAVVNEAVWQFDYDGSDFQGRETFLEATSISTFGRGNQWSLQSKGLKSELGAYWFAEWVSARLFRRFAGTPGGLKGGAPVLTIEAFLLTLPVWAGDYVYVTHAQMPDVTSGALGVTNRIYEVIDRSPDYANGRMKYRLLDTGLTGAPASKKWGTDFVIGTSPIY